MSQSRDPSAEPHSALQHAKTRRAGQERAARDTRHPQKQLGPLPEDSNEVEDGIVVDEDVFPAVLESGELSDSKSESAYDTYSQKVLDSLNPDDMEQNLADLNAKARRLLAQFKTRTGLPAELQSIIRESRDPKSRQRQRVDGCWSNLEELQTAFVHGGTYLKPDTILRSLLRKTCTQPLPKASRPWRPDDILYKANLAILVRSGMTNDGGQVVAELSLDQIFPSPFTLGFSVPGTKIKPGSSTLIRPTFEFALELRTIGLVGMLDDNKTQDAAATLIEKVMLNFDQESDEYEDDMDAIQSLQTALSNKKHAGGWNFLNPHGFETEEYADMIIRRTQEIKRLLFDDVENPFVDKSASLKSGLAKLRQRFSWEQYQTHLLRWVNLRLTEIDNSIKQLGGIDEIVTALEQEIKERRENPQAYKDDEDDSEDEVLPQVRSNLQPISNHTTPAPQGSSTKKAARPLTLFRGRPGASTAAPASGVARAEQTEETTHIVASNQFSLTARSSLAPRPASLTGMLARANNLDEQERQKPRFIDAQPNGVRIQDDILESQHSERGGFRLPGSQQSERQTVEVDPTPPNEVEDDGVRSPSQDEGFQTDQRVLPAVRRQPRTSAVPLQALTVEENTQPPRRRGTSEAETPRKRPRTNPGQLLEPVQSTGEDDEADAVKLATWAAKLEARRGLSKQQRARKVWTDAENGALLRYIRDYGISYAYIKQMDQEGLNVLEDRNAEDIRFKARDLKVRFLIGKRELPENLELVPLGKKEIDRVNKYVHYEQVPSRSRITHINA